VKTAEVTWRPLVKEIRTVGRLTYDESRLACVAARVAGRIDKLFVDFTGSEVKKGDPLVLLYSPALYSAQEEYLLALETLTKVKDSPIKEAVSGAQELALAAKERLLLWGIFEEQITELERQRKPQTHLTIHSPLSGTVIEKKVREGVYINEGKELYHIAALDHLWMLADIYEYEMGWLSPGQEVEMTSATYPGEVFKGTISFIDPFLDEKTRSVKVRVEVPNTQGKLKPEMFVNAVLRVPIKSEEGLEVVQAEYTCPMHPEVTSLEPGRCNECGMFLVKKETPPAGKVLTIPKSAVLDTGLRQIVYVEEAEGAFVCREVKLGQEAQGFYEVLSGLSEGERVVASGAFLIDAEAELSPGVSIQYFGAEEKKTPAHSH
jgi:RND family efflux transporter MFP subunit